MIETIGIAIPCFNEEEYIEKCILSVMTSNFDITKLEVVVCDGMSTDNSREIILRLCQTYKNLRLIDNPQKVTPVAMNLGFKALPTDAKIILGAHSEVLPDFLANNVKALNEYPDTGCVGGIINNIYENDISKTIGLAMSSPFGVGNARFRTGGKDGYVDTVAFGAYRSSIFEKIGYFDESLVRNQDDEMNYRINSNGYKIYLANDIQSNYYVRGSLSKLFKQYYQYGYWKVYVNKKVKTVTTIRQLFPAILVLSIFIGGLLSLVHVTFFIFWLSGILSYILLSFYFALKKSRQPNEVINIVKAFYILHFSYGFGYLKGMLDFLILSKNPSNKNTAISR